MWLDKETGIKCFMLSARKVNIVWGDTPLHWRWIPVTGSRFFSVSLSIRLPILCGEDMPLINYSALGLLLLCRQCTLFVAAVVEH
jgi:hypothetical protein